MNIRLTFTAFAATLALATAALYGHAAYIDWHYAQIDAQRTQAAAAWEAEYERLLAADPAKAVGIPELPFPAEAYRMAR